MNMIYRHMNPPLQKIGPEEIVVSEPFVFSTVSMLIGKPVVLETSRGRVSGVVMNAKPDHLVLKEQESMFFVRLCEVV